MNICSASVIEASPLSDWQDKDVYCSSLCDRGKDKKPEQTFIYLRMADYIVICLDLNIMWKLNRMLEFLVWLEEFLNVPSKASCGGICIMWSPFFINWVSPNLMYISTYIYIWIIWAQNPEEHWLLREMRMQRGWKRARLMRTQFVGENSAHNLKNLTYVKFYLYIQRWH